MPPSLEPSSRAVAVLSIRLGIQTAKSIPLTEQIHSPRHPASHDAL
jgi:hypothetical protein